MNPICPFAIQTPGGTPGGQITPRVIILHSDTANGNIPQPANGLEWHFHIDYNGTIRQVVPVNLHADANYMANGFAVSIETSSNPGATDLWNQAQLDSIVRLCRWLSTDWNISLDVVQTWNGCGIGFHRMFSAWNNPYHSCPGDNRADQFYSYLVPQLSNNQPPPPTPVEEDVKTALISNSKGEIWALQPGAINLGKTYIHTPDVLNFILSIDKFTGGSYLVSPQVLSWPDTQLDAYFVSGPEVSGPGITSDQLSQVVAQVANATSDELAKRIANG